MVEYYECDCGARYGHPDQIIACAQNGHGKGNPEIARQQEVIEDLLAALEIATTNAQKVLDFMDCRPQYDDHPLKPLLHAIRMPARAAIAKAKGQS